MQNQLFLRHQYAQILTQLKSGVFSQAELGGTLPADHIAATFEQKIKLIDSSLSHPRRESA